MLVNWSDYLTHLKPVKYFAFVNDSGFVSSSLAPLSFDFAMDWTPPKTSDFVTRLDLVKDFAFAIYFLLSKLSTLVNWSDCLTHLDPAKYFGSGFVLGFGFVNLTTVGIQFVSVTYCPSLKPSLFVNLSGFVME